MRSTRQSWFMGVVGLFVCGACSDASKGTDDRSPATSPDAGAEPDAGHARMFESGSRLRARLVEANDEAAQFIGFHDSDLEVDCSPALAYDGELRCLPESGRGQVFFLDAQCTQPVYRASGSTSCEEDTTVYVRSSLGSNNTCAEARRARVYSVGAALPEAELFGLANGACRSFGRSSCVRNLAEVSPTSFALGKIETRAADHGIAIDWLVYADGAQAIRGIRDVARDVPCDTQPGITSARCLPTERASVNAGQGDLFLVSTCAGAAVAQGRAAGETCADPSIAIVSEAGDRCQPNTLTVHELGTALSGAFRKVADRCEEFTASSSERLYEVGDPVDLETLPRLTNARVGSERIAVQYVATQDGTPLRHERPAFYDRELELPCAAVAMADGVTRCVPRFDRSYIEMSGPFGSPECAQPLLPVLVAESSCSDPARTLVGVRDAQDRLSAVHELGSLLPASPEQVYVMVEGGCTATAADSRNAYYGLGRALDLATLTERSE